MNKKELNQILIGVDKKWQELGEKSGLKAANDFLADFLKSHQRCKDIRVEKLFRCHFLDFWDSLLGWLSSETTAEQDALRVESYKQVYSAVFAGADYLKEYEDKIAARKKLWLINNPPVSGG